MTRFELKYHHDLLTFELPASVHVDVISPLDVLALPDPSGAVREALENPLGAFSWHDHRAARSAAIAINDKTRPVPHAILLPPLLAKLESLGIPPERITLIIASGTHIPMPADEFERILPPEIIARYPIVAHDCDAPDLVSLGVTAAGTPVFANPLFLQADLRVVIGNIEPHHFMGFSGGVKSAAVGLTGRTTINRNHAMLGHPLAVVGHYSDNPMRQDVEEIGRMIGVHLALNAILNNDKGIVRALAGDPLAVMEAGISVARNICQVAVDRHYDLVIASAGGAPKDINFYQSQKALTHAALTARDGGTVILVAACPEGVGSAGYEAFMQDVNDIPGVFVKFERTGFMVGPHKAFQVAKIATRVNVKLYSHMPAETVRRVLLIEPVSDAQAAIDAALAVLPANANVAIMPIATITIPVMEPGG